MGEIDFEISILRNLLKGRSIPHSYNPIKINLSSSHYTFSGGEYQVFYRPKISYAGEYHLCGQEISYREDFKPNEKEIAIHYLNEVYEELMEYPKFKDFIHSSFLEVLAGEEEINIIQIPIKYKFEDFIQNIAEKRLDSFRITKKADVFYYNAEGYQRFKLQENLIEMEKGIDGLLEQRIELIKFHLEQRVKEKNIRFELIEEDGGFLFKINKPIGQIAFL